jgi:hypothetical protein
MRLSLLLVAAGAACYSQVSARVALSNGIQLTVTTRSDNGPPKLKPTLEPASGDSFYRIFRDENDLAVFAYELQVARTADGENFRITAKPATQDFAARFPNSDGGKPAPTLSAPLESPLLSSGQAFEIPIPTAPELGQTLTDTVQILMAQRGVENEATSASARIQFLGLKVSIHGQPVTPSGAGADVAGRYTMFFLPGHGGYFFSTEPVAQPPFLGVGIVDGGHLTFTIDNEMYDCTARAPILVHSTRGQLWVYHDPNYRPGGNWTKADLTTTRQEFFTAASDSLRWWVR